MADRYPQLPGLEDQPGLDLSGPDLSGPSSRHPVTVARAAASAHPGVLVAVRVGDFYEFFDAAAQLVAGILGLTLLDRDHHGTRVPMAGVPFHSVEKYLPKLIAAGQTVALCDLPGPHV